MSQRLFFIGALDYPNIPQAGDAVKNRFLLDYFGRELHDVSYVDTQNWKRNPLILVRVMLKLLFRRFDNIVISTSTTSAYRLIRLITSLHLKSRIYYFMIAGYAPVRIKAGDYKAEPYRRLERIVVEADKVSELFHELGIDNTLRLYNFKLKGIFHILESVRALNREGLGESFEVDFYGRTDADIREEFLNEVDSLENVSYNGFLQLDGADGYKALSEYDAMLFPTMHVTEGFPGVIADAAISGLPVIASDWQYAQEIIGHGRCGLLFPVGDNQALTDNMRAVIKDRGILEPMRRNALERSEMYNVDKVLTRELIERLGMDKPVY